MADRVTEEALRLAEDIMSGGDPTPLIAAALQKLMDERDMEHRTRKVGEEAYVEAFERAEKAEMRVLVLEGLVEELEGRLFGSRMRAGLDRMLLNDLLKGRPLRRWLTRAVARCTDLAWKRRKSPSFTPKRR